MTFLAGPPLRHLWREGGRGGRREVSHTFKRPGGPADVSPSRRRREGNGTAEGFPRGVILRAVHSRWPLVLEEGGGGELQVVISLPAGMTCRT